MTVHESMKLLTFTLLLLQIPLTTIAYGTVTDVSGILSEAEQEISLTYVSIVKAGEDGADTHNLLTALNEQLRRLSRAKEFLRRGETAQAELDGRAIIVTCAFLSIEAASLGDKASASSMYTWIGGIVAVPIIATLAGTCYYFLSKYWDNRRLRRNLDMEII